MAMIERNAPADEGGAGESGRAPPSNKECTPDHKESSLLRWIEAVCAVAIVIITAAYTWYASRQVDLMRESVDAARDSVNVALGAMAQARATAQLDQRPWINVSSFRLDGDPASGKPFTVWVSISNTGRSPAVDVVHSNYVAAGRVQPPVTWDDDSKDYSTVVFPGEIGHVFPTPYETLSPTMANAYRRGEAQIYVFIKMSYLDPNGQRHWTEACASVQHGAGFAFCLNGNRVDH